MDAVRARGADSTSPGVASMLTHVAKLACLAGLSLLGGSLASADGQQFSAAGFPAPAAVYQPGENQVVDLPPPPIMTGGATVTPIAAVTDNAADPPRYVTQDELKADVQKLAWTKGDFTFTPYGILWANLVAENGRTTPGNFPLWVTRPRPNENDDCYIDVRSTRLGVDLLGPRVPFFDCARSGGKVEIDFQRQIDVENKPSLLLRHAYVEVKNDDFRLLFGQTWDVISPLNPGVLFYSVGWDGGNIGYRRPQLRGERYFAVSDTLEVIAQGSLDTVAPSDTTGTATTYSALSSGWPLVEGRLAAVVGPRGPGCLPWEFGVSSHVGEMIYDLHKAAFNISQDAFGVPEKTWSLNLDVRAPITAHFGLQGELFMGENLGSFLGCDGQSVDIMSFGGTLASGDTIRSRGGWIDVWYDWTPRLHSHTGYSIDDPLDEDVTSGRIYNGFYFANVSYDLTSRFMVGLEYLNWKTIWDGPSVTAVSNNFNFVVKYSF
jgi:hypothetical protein